MSPEDPWTLRFHAPQADADVCSLRRLNETSAEHPILRTSLQDDDVSAFIEATPAAPVDALTFQRFGALRNPPVPERGEVYGGLKPVE